MRLTEHRRPLAFGGTCADEIDRKFVCNVCDCQLGILISRNHFVVQVQCVFNRSSVHRNFPTHFPCYGLRILVDASPVHGMRFACWRYDVQMFAKNRLSLSLIMYYHCSNDRTTDQTTQMISALCLLEAFRYDSLRYNDQYRLS